RFRHHDRNPALPPGHLVARGMADHGRPPCPGRDPLMPSRQSLVAAFAAIYLFWGATFLALRYAVAEVPPLLTIAIRCAAGALIIFGWLAARGRLEPFTRQQWLVAGGAGLLLFLGGHGILAWAEMEVPSGQAALLLTAIPSWLVLLEAIRLRRMPPGRVLAGLIVGTVGV